MDDVAARARRVLAAAFDDPAWPPDLDPDARYLPLPDLFASGLAARVCDRLGGAPLRAGRSIAVIGLASRLWSLTVVPAVRHGVVVEPDAVCGRDDAGTLRLGVRTSMPRPVTTADDVRDVVLQVLAPVVAALPPPTRLLWGNAASSLLAVPRVHHLPEARSLVAGLLAEAPFAGELQTTGPETGRRRTCCLFHLVPGGALCADCVLDHPPGSRLSG